jgi:hypothetical protein
MAESLSIVEFWTTLICNILNLVLKLFLYFQNERMSTRRKIPLQLLKYQLIHTEPVNMETNTGIGLERKTAIVICSTIASNRDGVEVEQQHVTYIFRV